MRNSQIEIIPRILIAFSITCVLMLHACTDRSCKIPAFVLKNTIQYTEIAEQLLLLQDSIGIKFQGYYKWNSSYSSFELLDQKLRQTNGTANPLVSSLIDLKVIKFRIVDNNVYFIYYYDSSFIKGEKITKYVVFENVPIDFTNSEGDHSWEIFCNDKISDKIRHIVEWEMI